MATASLGLPLTNTEGRIGNPTIMLLATIIMVGNIGDVTKQPTVTKLDTYVRAIELLAGCQSSGRAGLIVCGADAQVTISMSLILAVVVEALVAKQLVDAVDTSAADDDAYSPAEMLDLGCIIAFTVFWSVPPRLLTLSSQLAQPQLQILGRFARHDVATAG